MRLSAVLLLAAFSAAGQPAPSYLAFQIFTGPRDSETLRRSFPPPPEDLRQTIAGLRSRVGTTGDTTHRLAFIIGPLSFDETDTQIRAEIAEAFDIALETNLAVGFHIDDSMFHGRRKDLNMPEALEWRDWNRTLNTGRQLDWSATPTEIEPQLCLNSEPVTKAVEQRASAIGREIARGLKRLRDAGKPDLFAGVIAGWETQIGRDFDTGQSLGYCALTNKGFSAAHPPADPDAARGEIVREFIGLWAAKLIAAGVPEGKVYSHVASAFPSAFCAACVPGLSTYPQSGALERWRGELAKHGNPAWASAEGAAIDPGQVGHGKQRADTETYLAGLFNQGAQLVNVFGWGVGAPDNPFRAAAESGEALAAYRKFLAGEPLTEHPAEDLPSKIHTIQAALPAWVDAHGSATVEPLMKQLDAAIKARRFDEAVATADRILALLAR